MPGRSPKRRQLGPIRLRAALGAALAWIVLSLVSGLLGNRFDTLLLPLWSDLWRAVTADITLDAGVVSLLSVLFLGLQAAFFVVLTVLTERVLKARLASRLTEVAAADDERRALVVSTALVQTDETLLRLLPALATAPNRDNAVKLLLEEFLRDATAVFGGDVSRGMVLRPADDDLTPWVGYQMPQETMDRTRFPLNRPSSGPEGVALKTFRDGKLCVTHLGQKNGTWRPDKKAYLVFAQSRPHPPYRSFVTVAIAG